MAPDWILSPLYSFPGGNQGEEPLAGVTIGRDGTLYGTAGGGEGIGCNGGGCGIVFNLRPPARACQTALCPWTENLLYAFQGGSDGKEPWQGSLILDQSGNIYGTTLFGGADDAGTVYQLTPSHGGWTEKVLHSFGQGDDGTFPGGGVTFDQAGDLYGTTGSGGSFGYGAVFQLTQSESVWAENILYAFQDGSDGRNTFAGLAIDSAGHLYGATNCGGINWGGTIFELTESNSWVFDVLYSLTWTPNTCGNGPNWALTIDSAGNLYGTTDGEGAYGFGNVFKLTRSTFGWTYTSLHDFTGGSDGAYPQGNLAFDAAGNLYSTTYAGGAYGGGVAFEITP